MTADPRFAYRENDVRAATPVGRVILLYEQAVQDLRGAMTALQSGDVECRTQKLSHALLVIGQLQACLDLDRGGEVSRNLDRFYSVVQARLLEAQFQSSADILEEQVDLLLSLRAAWIEVEIAESKQPNTPPKAPSTGMSGPAAESSAPSHWRA